MLPSWAAPAACGCGNRSMEWPRWPTVRDTGSVASDGGVFAEGSAPFRGSMGGSPLSSPVLGMASDRSTGGYWLVASDGGVFSFGAPFLGAG